MKFKQSNLLEWNFKPEIKIGIKTIKTEIKTIILKSEWKLKRNKKRKENYFGNLYKKTEKKLTQKNPNK